MENETKKSSTKFECVCCGKIFRMRNAIGFGPVLGPHKRPDGTKCQSRIGRPLLDNSQE
jgi:hypothetical protein